MSRKLVSYRLTDDLQQALKERATLEGISATELVNRLLRQGLAGSSAVASSAELRLSRLEQVMHQIEKRVESMTEVSINPLSSVRVGTLPLEGDIETRLQEVEKKLEALTAGVEEGCQSLKTLSQVVRSALPPERQIEQAQAIHQFGRSGPNPQAGSIAQDVVPVSLEALRKLLQSDT